MGYSIWLSERKAIEEPSYFVSSSLVSYTIVFDVIGKLNVPRKPPAGVVLYLYILSATLGNMKNITLFRTNPVLWQLLGNYVHTTRTSPFNFTIYGFSM